MPLVIPSRPNAIRMHVEAEMANMGCRPQVALEIDGVSAILDLVADGAGAALLSRNAVASSIRPSAYRMRLVSEPPLRTRHVSGHQLAAPRPRSHSRPRSISSARRWKNSTRAEPRWTGAAA